MRLWSVHPKYLDARGLVALWREGLLAQAVLRGRTNGYRHHPQLERFRAQPSPLGAIADYLRSVHDDAIRRGFVFSRRKINRVRCLQPIAVPRGQLRYEWEHLMMKLSLRDPELRLRLELVRRPQAHPLFRIVPGGSESWEKLPNNSLQRTVRFTARR